MMLPPPGWYPDPKEPTRQRYWNGESWTDDFAPHPPGYVAPHPPGSFAGPAGDFIPAEIRTAPFENARGLANATIVLLAHRVVEHRVGVRQLRPRIAHQ